MRRNTVLSDVAGPALLALLVVAILIGTVLYSSAAATDRVSLGRQDSTVAKFADTMGLDIAAALQVNTRWDDAVRQTHKPVLDMSWMDSTFGPYLLAQLGWNESYLVNPANQAYYAESDGRRVNPRMFQHRLAVIEPLIAKLRREMLSSTTHFGYGKWKSPAVVQFRSVDGKPAIIILNPIVSDSGKIVQKPGTEHLNIVIYWLDDRNLQRIWGRKYSIDEAHFSWRDRHGANEASRAMLSSDPGRPGGYFVWQPYRPGWIVLRAMLVPLGLGLLVTVLLIWSLGRRLVRSTAQLMASEAQARQLAFHDVLTGLPNRALFEDRLDRALGQSITSGRPATLLLLDLDRFKCVNDTLGHPAGDDLIREVARRLSGLIRKDDTAARLGGDEFAIILNGVNGRREINSFCRRVNKTLTAPFDLLGSQAFIGVSIGLARAPLDGLDRSELTRKADIALYEAKASGRGCHRIFGATMDTAVQYRRRIERELREALRDGSQLELHYQPQYDASSLSIRGVEALVRWNHPDLGLLAPTTFVPIAEECGLAEDLGNWVLKQACRSAREWPDLVVSVNVSAVQVRSVKFVESVLRIVGEARLDPRRLELELTETALLDNLAQCEANLSALRSHGVRIALDDFGTGYSSLSHLRSIRIDRVKIDQSFVQGMEDETGGAIIQAIVYLARSTGLRVTAEGVETSRQRELLSHIGCDELQGFGLSTPLPFEAFDAAYRSRFPQRRQVAA